MKKLIVLISFLFGLSAHAAHPSFDLDKLPVSSVVRLVYVEAFKDRSYYLGPDILSDPRLISFRYSPKDGDFFPLFKKYLNDLGYQIETNKSSDLITKFVPSEKHEIPPSPIEDTNIDLLHYIPKYRDANYLMEIVSPLFKGQFTNKKSIGGSVPMDAKVSETSALGQMSKATDQILFYGSRTETAALKALLEKVDTAQSQVVVDASLYEVQVSDREGSALALIGSLLSGKFQMSIGSAQKGDDFMSIKLGGLEGIIQALSADSRFKLVSSPRMRLVNNKPGSFIVGDEVPVLGAVTYPTNGQPVQSVEYRSAGMIFNVTPDIKQNIIDLDIDQQISSFVSTTNGVNNSPTLTKRQLKTSVAVTENEIIALGGLQSVKESGSTSNFIFESTRRENSNTQIVLFLHARKI